MCRVPGVTRRPAARRAFPHHEQVARPDRGDRGRSDDEPGGRRARSARHGRGPAPTPPRRRRRRREAWKTPPASPTAGPRCRRSPRASIIGFLHGATHSPTAGGSVPPASAGSRSETDRCVALHSDEGRENSDRVGRGGAPCRTTSGSSASRGPPPARAGGTGTTRSAWGTAGSPTTRCRPCRSATSRERGSAGRGTVAEPAFVGQPTKTCSAPQRDF